MEIHMLGRRLVSLQEPSSGARPGESWAVMDPVFRLS
jgi:hypothetical protein